MLEGILAAREPSPPFQQKAKALEDKSAKCYNKLNVKKG